MRTVELREYQTARGLALSPEECDGLRLTVPDLVVSPTLGDSTRVDVTAGATVGLVEIGDTVVTIRPKVALGRLLFLVSYAADPTAWKSLAASFIDADSLVEAVIPAFVRQVRGALAGGALQGYRSQDDALATIRGRIRFADQIARRFGDRLPVEVTYDDFTVDIEINRVIKAAIHRLGKMRIRAEGARRSLRAFDGQLEGVTLVEYDRRSLPRFTWSRLNRRYRAAVELALLILRSSSIEALPGGRRASALLVDMNRVFEDFLAVALAEASPASGMALIRHGVGTGLTLDVAGRIRLRPDLSWWSGSRCVAVADAKYKRIAPAGFLHGDVYQMHAYLAATGLTAGMLVYAEGETDTIEHLLIDQGRRVLVRALRIDGEPGEILTEVDRLAEEIRALTDAESAAAAPAAPAL